jgi:hypothetical protein
MLHPFVSFADPASSQLSNVDQRTLAQLIASGDWDAVLSTLMAMNTDAERVKALRHLAKTSPKSFRQLGDRMQQAVGHTEDRMDDASLRADMLSANQKATLRGNNNAQRAMNFFTDKLTREKHLSPQKAKMLAAGIVGNLMQESNVNPAASGDGNSSHGIAQWHNQRFTKMAAAVPNWRNNLGGQLEYLWKDMQSGDGGNALNKLVSGARNPAQAAGIFQAAFERAGAPNNARRMAYANQLYQQHQDVGDPAAVA